ncbi:MAG: PKD domain-containing protein [Chitinophagales bacterium]
MKKIFLTVFALGLGCYYLGAQAVWLGNTSQWLNAGNWSTGVAPNSCSTDVIIPSSPSGGFFPLLGLASVQVGNLTIEEGASLTINNVSVSVCGNFTGGAIGVAVINGNTNGRLVLNGTGPQIVDGQIELNTLRINNSTGVQLNAGAALDVHRALELQDGDFDVTNGLLTFRSSSASSIAILDNFSSGFSGTLTGNATVTRFIPVSGFNQHYFGTPVSGAGFAQLGASGVPGFIIPTANCDESQVAANSPYGTVFEWHDDVPANASCLYNGWEVKTGGITQPGRGYSVYLTGGTFSITGDVNQAGSYAVNGLNNIGWQSNTLQTAGFLPPAYESGWHIVANPYLAPLSLNGHAADFDAAAVWVTSGPFAGSYQPIPITGGSIAPFQGFIVHRSSPSPAPFIFSKSECVTTPGAVFSKTASQNALSIQVSGNGFNDITYVEFNSAATNAYDVELDSRKPLSVLGQPSLFTFNTNPAERLSVNVNRTITESPDVAMNFIPGANGTFTFSTTGLNTFDPTSYVLLEDKKTGQWIDLRLNASYTFTSSTTDAHNRFVLHFTPAALFAGTDASCNAQGVITATQSGSAVWNYTITNNQGNNIGSGTLSNASPFSLSVPAGVYTITLTDANNYAVVKNIQVNGVNPITATMLVNTTTAETGEDITFQNSSLNAISAEWNFGDGTIENSLSATHSYTNEGTYTVTLTVTNADGCIASTQQTITVTAKQTTAIREKELNNIRFWSAANTVFVDFSKLTHVDATIDIYNMLGQKLSSEKLAKAAIYSRALDIQAVGYVLIGVKCSEGTVTKKLLLANH